MSLDKAIVSQVAHLARIEVTKDQIESLVDELNHILAWIEQLNEVETDGVSPLASITGHSLPQRKDVVSEEENRDHILDNAPDRTKDFYSVPKVVE